jgi:hypothetical protein
MEPYEQEQWKELDQSRAEAEKKLLAPANLGRAAEAQERTEAKLAQLAGGNGAR